LQKKILKRQLIEIGLKDLLEKLGYEVALENKVQFGIFFMYTQKEILTYVEIKIAVAKAIEKLNKIIVSTDIAKHQTDQTNP
jgi:hypothetical protein